MAQRKVKPVEGLQVFLHDLFDLHEDKERDSKAIADIRKGVEFKGTNLWILIFAIIIASVGLNVNSTAVIIGAMLISPLMGPIMGIGLGAGINDFELIKKAFFNLSIAVAISILTSALYFLITPLHEAQSELLARTNPTLWDVMIAFFGGLAGIVASSRKEKTNAIPGVAIATALMPPLCTAGYALANGNLYFFAGAFYLFFINSVFITFATFLIVRFLNYPKKKFEDPATEKHVKRLIGFFVVLTLTPSVYLAYHLVQKTLYEQNARQFIAVEFNSIEREVIHKEFFFGADSAAIEVTLYGKPLEKAEIKAIERQLPVFNLGHVHLIINQGYKEELNLDQEFAAMSSQLKIDIVEDLYRESRGVIASKDEKIDFLERELIKQKAKVYPVEDVATELKIQYTSLQELAISDVVKRNLTDSVMDTVTVAMVKFQKPIRRTDQKKAEAWLRQRLKVDELELVILK